MIRPSLESVSVGLSTQRLKIGIVTETYPPEINGVARTVERMARWLHERGHDLHLVRPRQGKSMVATANLGTITVPGIPIPFYSELRVGLPPFGKAKAELNELEFDVLYVATEGLLGWWSVRQARRRGIPVVTGFHTNFHLYTRHYGFRLLSRPAYAYLRRLHYRATRTLVPTGALKRQLEADGFRGVETLARGVDSELFTPERRSDALRRKWGVSAGELAVLYVGRLAPEKNLELLVDAFQAMRRNNPKCRLIVVGDGPSRQRLMASLPTAVFCGQQVGESLAAHYASADVFLFPSLSETYGNVTLEAMASGLGIVAFDYAAANDLIDNKKEGLLVPCNKPKAFVGQAASLATDPAIAAALGAAARKKAEGCTWLKVLSRFEEILSDCVT